MEAFIVLSRDSELIDSMGQAAVEHSCMLVLCEASQSPLLPSNTRVRSALIDRDDFVSDEAFTKALTFLRTRHPNCFILVISQALSLSQQISALNAGSDTCLVKPITPELLLAYLRALARGNAAEAKQAQKQLRRLDALELDIESYTARYSGSPIPLTTAEFTLLEVLTRNPGKPVHHEALGNALWGWDSDNYSGHLKCHISRLRAKLASADCSAKIISVRGTGYAVSR